MATPIKTSEANAEPTTTRRSTAADSGVYWMCSSADIGRLRDGGNRACAGAEGDADQTKADANDCDKGGEECPSPGRWRDEISVVAGDAKQDAGADRAQRPLRVAHPRQQQGQDWNERRQKKSGDGQRRPRPAAALDKPDFFA